MFTMINLGSLISCKLKRLPYTVNVLESIFPQGKEYTEELTANNTEVSKVNKLENCNYQWHMISLQFTSEVDIDNEK